MIAALERYQGCLLGLAVGDCLGAPVEFASPGSFEPVTAMRGGGTFHLEPGQWTDDTSMALCLGASLVARRGFDAADQLERYLRWYRQGYLSSTGRCFDIGRTTERALIDYEVHGWTASHQTRPTEASNGSIMRLAPAALAYAARPAQAVEICGQTSLTTHAAPAAVDACRYLGALIAGAVRGADREELAAPFYSPVPGLWEQAPLNPQVAEVAGGSFLSREPPEIRNGSEAVRCLESALWGFAHFESFEEGVLQVVNLGDDADTAAAVYGQLAGAYFGLAAIPAGWREAVVQPELILRMAAELYGLAEEMRSTAGAAVQDPG